MLWVRVDPAKQRPDEAQKVRPQPGHPRELRAVSDLVERYPEAELARLETVAVFELDHVVAEVVDDVLVRGSLIFDQKLVVLSEDAS